HAFVEAPIEGVFQRFAVSVPRVAFDVGVTPLRFAQRVPSIASGGAARAAVEPAPESFGKGAAWRIDIPTEALSVPGLSNAYL
ncbi:glycoside hydrolase family 35, partial [Burkholderia sp. SIMBA_019]